MRVPASVLLPVPFFREELRDLIGPSDYGLFVSYGLTLTVF